MIGKIVLYDTRYPLSHSVLPDSNYSGNFALLLYRIGYGADSSKPSAAHVLHRYRPANLDGGCLAYPNAHLDSIANQNIYAADTDIDPHAYRNANSYLYGDSHTHAYLDRNPYAYSHGLPNTHLDGYFDIHCHVYTITDNNRNSKPNSDLAANSNGD